MNVFLLYPIHLFADLTELKSTSNNISKIYLIEDPRYFTDFNYHKLKLAYHRATMRSYFDILKGKIDISIKYIELDDTKSFYKKLAKSSNKYYTYSLGDDVLENRLKKLVNLSIINSPNFTVNKDLIMENKDIFYNNKTKKYNFMNFYKWQRERLNILMTSSGKPLGGRWSFDDENRQKLPEKMIPDEKYVKQNNKYVKEAIKYVNKKFPNSYGSLDYFIYPIDNSSAKKWLKTFIAKRFKNFGLYEDAETPKSNFIYHSVLSPMMNIGILTDNEILAEVKKYVGKIPINSMEGFVRQIIGWRNYIYAVYMLDGANLKKMNYLKHRNKLKEDMIWMSNTGIEPIDFIMSKITKYSYAHHIERLMYLGNFMLLCQINPQQVYKLFMEWTIDAYEWVMVPNVFSMSQYADGGKMMTRPYFSSSNYILSMSDYKCGDWCIVWNSLYYYFIYKHKKIFKKNYAIARQVKHWDNKSKSKQKNIILLARKVLKTFCSTSN